MTDSISFCKPDMSPFSKEERELLVKELNEISPEFMVYEDDGYYSRCLVIRAKNYVLVDEEGKRKIKGSALKDQKASKKIIEFKLEIVEALLEEKSKEDLITIYNKYILETGNIVDIHPWCKKLTVTEKITNCKGHEQLSKEEKKDQKIRLNETSVYDAIKHKDFQEGDKVWVYKNLDKGLTLSEEFNNNYDRDSLLHNLFSSSQIFKNVIDTSIFLNYKLKRNKKLLKEII